MRNIEIPNKTRDDSVIQNRVYYHDTDAVGVVYYARYLEHLEEGRAEFCRAKGVDLSAYMRKGVRFSVVHLEIEYKAPARYGDSINIITRLDKIGNASLHFFQEIKRGEALLLKAKIVWACIGDDFKARSVPDEISRLLIR